MTITSSALKERYLIDRSQSKGRKTKCYMREVKYKGESACN